MLCCCVVHTHPFNGPLSGTTQVSRYQKVCYVAVASILSLGPKQLAQMGYLFENSVKSFDAVPTVQPSKIKHRNCSLIVKVMLQYSI